MGNSTKRETAERKAAFLEAFRKSAGILKPACDALNIDRKTIWRWRQNDPKFDEACRECHEIAIDFAESALLKNIQNGDTTAIIFYLKTQGKNRGYVEKQQVEAEVKGATVKVNVLDQETADLIDKL